MSELKTRWQREIPILPGLYWRTVCTTARTWHTEFVNVSVEEHFDRTKTVRITDVTPRFLQAQPEAPLTELRKWEPSNNHPDEYFLGPIEPPAAPDPISMEARMPPEPGLYYRSFYASHASGWQHELVSVSILRAAGFADLAWKVSLPDLKLNSATAHVRSMFAEIWQVKPPRILPHGANLLFAQGRSTTPYSLSRKK